MLEGTFPSNWCAISQGVMTKTCRQVSFLEMDIDINVRKGVYFNPNIFKTHFEIP